MKRLRSLALSKLEQDWKFPAKNPLTYDLMFYLIVGKKKERKKGYLLQQDSVNFLKFAVKNWGGGGGGEFLKLISICLFIYSIFLFFFYF